MIHLIHGPDTVASRNYLQRLREGNSEIVTLDCRRLTKELLAENLNQSKLFASTLVIIDWLEEKHLPLDLSSQADILIVWSAQNLKDFAWADKVTTFPIKAVTIFKLADSFGLRQLALSQINLEAVLREKETPEAIVGMLARQLKLISFHLSGNLEAISKSSFVKNKIADQSKLWSERGIKRAFRALLEADLAIKSGLEPRVVLSLALTKINP